MTELLILGGLALATLVIFYVKRRMPASFYRSEPDGWFAGPLIKGKNKSIDVKVSDARFRFPIGHDGIHYFTKARGPITGAAVSIKGYIDAPEGTRFVGVEDGARGTMSVYFSAGDVDWFGEGYDRWFCPLEYRYDLKPGPFEIEVPLSGTWVSAINTDSQRSPDAFRAALQEGGRIGLVFGGNEGRGHGSYATQEAWLTVLGVTYD